MAYCSLPDINALCAQAPFTDTSKPSAASVRQWMDDISIQMDNELSNVGYVTPVVTGAKALQDLKLINAWGALGLALAARNTGVSTGVMDGATERDNLWWQRYRARMKALTNPQDATELSDAPRTTEQLQKQPENVLRSSVQSVDDTNWLTPLITREQVL